MTLVGVRTVYISTVPQSSSAYNRSIVFFGYKGETFELDRRDEEGSEFRLLGEQVSHHPPRCAMHVESERHGWVCFQDFSSEMKLAAAQMLLRPIGARISGQII